MHVCVYVCMCVCMYAFVLDNQDYIEADAYAWFAGVCMYVYMYVCMLLFELLRFC